MDTSKELIQVCGFIQGMHNFGVDLTLSLHALQISDVAAVKENRFETGFGKFIRTSEFNPSPRAIVAQKTAARGPGRFGIGSDFDQMNASGPNIERMHEVSEMLAPQICGRAAKHLLECTIGKKQRSVGAENCNQFVGGIEQSCKLLSPKNEPRLRNATLGHGLFASQLAEKQSAACRTFGSLPETDTAI